MKKLLLSLAALTAFGAAHAQKTGDVFVNGSIGYQHSNSEWNAGNKAMNGPVTNHFFIMPSVGYQFNNNWGAGITMKYEYNHAKFAPGGLALDTTNRTNTFGVGPFLRYTKQLSPLFFVNGQLNALYVTGKATLETAGTTTTTGRRNGVDVNVMPSIGINVTRCLALTGSMGRLGYATVKDENPSNSSIYTRENAFDVTFGREFALGLQWNFGAGRTHRHRAEPMSETRRMDRYRDNDGDNETPADEAPRRRRRSRD